MKVKILRSTMVCAELVSAGEVVEVTEADGIYLQRIGKAVEVKDEPEPKKEGAVDISGMTKAQLVEHAKTIPLELDGALKKDEMLAKIAEALAAKASA